MITNMLYLIDSHKISNILYVKIGSFIGINTELQKNNIYIHSYNEIPFNRKVRSRKESA